MKLLIDGHIDIAMNSLCYERDERLTVQQIRDREHAPNPSERGTCTLSIPEFRAANAAVVVGTLFIRCKPNVDPARTILREDADFPCPTMSYSIAQAQVAYYKLLEQMGELKFINTSADLQAHLKLWERSSDPVADKLPVGLILMMEGADPIVDVSQLQQWYDQGLRCVSLAHFGHSRFACGTPSAAEPDGPLTPLGRDLLVEMDRLGVVLDLSHISDQSFAEATDIYQGPLIATHTNCRAICEKPRQMTDPQIKKIISRGGIMGAVMCVSMIRNNFKREMPHDVTINEVCDHILHVCDLAGNTDHIGFGTDMDGGFGADWTPVEIDTFRDLHKFEDALASRGFSDEDIAKFFYKNWSDFWAKNLPSV